VSSVWSYGAFFLNRTNSW